MIILPPCGAGILHALEARASTADELCAGGCYNLVITACAS